MAEVDCEACGGYSDHHNTKAVCIHCFNSQVKKTRRMMRENTKLREKLDALKNK